MPFPAILAGIATGMGALGAAAATAASIKGMVDSSKNNKEYRAALNQQAKGNKKQVVSKKPVSVTGTTPAQQGMPQRQPDGTMSTPSKNGIISTTDPRSEIGKFFLGNQEGMNFIPRFTPDQMKVLNSILSQSSQAMDNNPYSFQGTEQYGLDTFKNKILPALAERFQGLGGNDTGGMSGLNIAGAQAGRQLGIDLSALRDQSQQQYQNMLTDRTRLGLTPAYEPTYQPATPGALQNMGQQGLQELLSRSPELFNQLSEMFSKTANAIPRPPDQPQPQMSTWNSQAFQVPMEHQMKQPDYLSNSVIQQTAPSVNTSSPQAAMSSPGYLSNSILSRYNKKIMPTVPQYPGMRPGESLSDYQWRVDGI